MKDTEKHTQANLYSSEVVAIAILFALKGVGNRPFYRWLKRDYLEMFPIGKKGLSNKRWIVGCKLCFVFNHIGLIVDWDSSPRLASETSTATR